MLIVTEKTSFCFSTTARTYNKLLSQVIEDCTHPNLMKDKRARYGIRESKIHKSTRSRHMEHCISADNESITTRRVDWASLPQLCADLCTIFCSKCELLLSLGACFDRLL